MANSLEQLVGSTPKIEKVVEGMTATEGPVFSRAGFLLFSDIQARRIMKFEDGKVTAFRTDSNRANGLTFDRLGRLLACEAGRVTRTEHDGRITVLADQFEGKGLNIPNDLVCAIDGSIYFSDLRFRDPPPNPARTDFSALYQITPQGKVRVVSRDCQRPNGMALTANHQKLYLADSGPRTLWIYDIAADGSLTNGHLFADMSSGRTGVPDGLKTDEDGNIWVAGPRGVWVFNARGEHLGIVALPRARRTVAGVETFGNFTSRPNVPFTKLLPTSTVPGHIEPEVRELNMTTRLLPAASDWGADLPLRCSVYSLTMRRGSAQGKVGSVLDIMLTICAKRTGLYPVIE